MSYYTYVKLNTEQGTYVLRIADIVEIFLHRNEEGAVDESFILLRHNGKLWLTKDQAERVIQTITEKPPL